MPAPVKHSIHRWVKQLGATWMYWKENVLVWQRNHVWEEMLN